MICEDTKESLSFLLLCTSECERVVELSRQELCTNLNFDPYSVFQFLDSENNGKISWTDLKFFLSKRSMAITRQYLELLITQYDSNLDNFLSLDEFKPFVLSSENPQLSSAALSRKVFPPSLYIESLLARHIELECNWQGRLQVEKKRLFLKSDFSAMDMFRVLAAENDTFIDVKSVFVFLSGFESEVEEEDCERIIRRIDTDADLRVSFQDFVAFIMPLNQNLPSPGRFSFSPAKRPRNKEMERPKTQSSSIKTRENFSTPRLRPLPETKESSGIIKVFKEQIEIGNACEKVKAKLTGHLDFSFDELIKLIDKQKKHFVTGADLEEVCKDLQVPYHIEEIELVLLSYTAEGKLSYRQVKDWIVPLNFKDHKRVSLYKDEGYRVFSADTLNDLISCLKKLLHSQVLLERLRKSLTPSLISQLPQVFKQIDIDKSGSVNLVDLRTFVSQSYNYREVQIRILYKTFSKSLHNEITYSDFLEELTPKLR